MRSTSPDESSVFNASGAFVKGVYAVSALLTPLAVALVGSLYSSSVKEREVQGRFVELAIAILREAPSESAQHLRGWAAEVVTVYSGVRLGEKATEDLVRNIQIQTAVSTKVCSELLRQASELMGVGEVAGAVSRLKAAEENCAR